MDAGLINGVLFLDLCKAFDTVDHKILIKKLFIYGIRNKSLDWFKSYLHNRKQFCVVNNATSYTQKVSCEVPQGSNLGPLGKLQNLQTQLQELLLATYMKYARFVF
jgi:hypothetical protein